jgi:hypothetical protein
MRLKMRPNHFLFFLAGVLTLLCACAGLKPSPTDVDPELEQRVVAYWALRMSDDYAEAYAYESPEFRKKHKLTAYVAELSGGILQEAEVLRLTADGDRAKADMKVSYDLSDSLLPTPGRRTRAFADHWQRIEGQWYHLYYPPETEPLPTDAGQKPERTVFRLPGGGVFTGNPASAETEDKKGDNP